MELTDQELVRNYLEGDASSLDMLVKRHTSTVYNFISRQIGRNEEASDITQEVFVKVWKNLKRYDSKQNFKTWLLAIARNASIDWLRKKRSFVFSDLDPGDSDATFEDTLTDSEPLPEELFERKESKIVVEHLLETLPENQKTAILLRNHEHLPFEEIASLMKKPENTVKSYYRRALLAMRKRLLEKPEKQTESAPN